MKTNEHVQNVTSLNDKITTKQIQTKKAYKNNIGIKKITTESHNVVHNKISDVLEKISKLLKMQILD